MKDRTEEETEIETLTTPSPNRHSPVPTGGGKMHQNVHDISRDSSTEIESDDDQELYEREIDQQSESSYESYDSVTGEIECCFT